jgi:uncharacterized membrane protein
MVSFALARAVHVLAVILWIGGVAMVTTVLLPAIRRHEPPARRFAAFHRLEDRFARQARWTTALAGASGFWMTWQIDGWSRFADADFWWMHAMVLTWLVFTLMLFVLEPLFLHRVLEARAARDPAGTWRVIERLHGGLLGLSLLTVAGAVAGAHGVNLFAW